MFGKKNDIESLKVIDFGLSGKEVKDFALTSKCGTTIYMAPEIFDNYQYTKVKEDEIVVCGLVECRHDNVYANN